MTIWQGGAGTPAGYMGTSHANGVVFVDANGVQQADPAQLSYNQTTKKFGLGPGSTLTFDNSSATLASNFRAQAAGIVGSTLFPIIPPTGSVISGFVAYNNPDLTAACSLGSIQINSTDFRINSGAANGGTFLPFIIRTNSSERLRIDNSGHVTLGGPVGNQSLRAIAVAGSTTWLDVQGSIGGSVSLLTPTGDIVLVPANAGNAKVSWQMNSISVPTNFLGGSIGQNRSNGAGEVNFYNNYVAQALSFDWRKVTSSGVSDSVLMYLTPSGGLSTTGGFGVNGFAPQSVITGYGTPTGGAKQPSFAAGAITLPNLAAAVAQLIVDLKSYGLFAA